MLSTAIEERFTIPGYESRAVKTNVMDQWLVQFEDPATGEVNSDLTIVIYAKWGTDENGFTTGLVTQSLPF